MLTQAALGARGEAVSDTMDKLADVLGHNYDCGLLTEEDDKIAHCTCGSDAVLVQVQAEFDELKRGSLTPVCCVKRTDNPDRLAKKNMDALPTPILVRSSGLSSSAANWMVAAPSAPPRATRTCSRYRSVGVCFLADVAKQPKWFCVTCAKMALKKVK